MRILKPILKRHPFLHDLNSDHLQTLAGCATIKEYAVGEYIFHESEEADTFYLITKGKVSLESSVPRDRAITVQFLEGGEMLGWSWLIPPHYWRFSARTQYPTEVIAMDGEFLRQQCQQDPVFGYALLERMALIISQRLEITRIKLLEPRNVEQV